MGLVQLRVEGIMSSLFDDDDDDDHHDDDDDNRGDDSNMDPATIRSILNRSVERCKMIAERRALQLQTAAQRALDAKAAARKERTRRRWRIVRMYFRVAGAFLKDGFKYASLIPTSPAVLVREAAEKPVEDRSPEVLVDASHPRQS
jgi:hypothetical protein